MLLCVFWIGAGFLGSVDNDPDFDIMIFIGPYKVMTILSAVGFVFIPNCSDVIVLYFGLRWIDWLVIIVSCLEMTSSSKAVFDP